MDSLLSRLVRVKISFNEVLQERLTNETRLNPQVRSVCGVDGTRKGLIRKEDFLRPARVKVRFLVKMEPIISRLRVTGIVGGRIRPLIKLVR